ncbi:hypothetical protein E2493_02595 [Sphingomonas parva]|uniref:Cysteine dioxygenase n=1 Tax=Sphingomonas parva TaxID=2555898 RepID=A0A4Y8ZWB0_9SPHN|nr:hypothetical protein [Sphingomonas parva]TFI59747.1 hypothetical protein E2493_02595 [Sphingomonas parva]
MATTAVHRFISAVQTEWGPISTDLVASCRQLLAELTLADPAEDWLSALRAEQPASRELHRDTSNGFMLLAHTEQRGLYRPPHDHGRAWVVYAVQSGELEVGSYGKVMNEQGAARLVRRGTHVLRPGEARAYLPGDIHDTRCTSETATLFRFTERDLRHEDQVEHKLTRFVERDGGWMEPAR